jgi:hypothetical protein
MNKGLMEHEGSSNILCIDKRMEEKREKGRDIEKMIV